MEFKDMKQLAQLMKEMGLTALEYKTNDASIRMERAAVPAAAPNTAVPAAAGIAAVEAQRETVAAAAPESASDIYTIASPMVGVFYAAASADSKPYVSIGDHIKAGDVLCIIEAMKMMNEITAEKSGIVTEICVGNKQIVEYGHPLFRMRLE